MKQLQFSSENQTLTSNWILPEPTSEGITSVKRLINIRRARDFERHDRIKKNRGLGSTKTAYSSSYRDFQTQ